ncbi:GreA/GreB family elongation factor [Polaromonas sp.]|uniref:GreA/GreB family elongation factor n=1 Tax=Polaromonas sp. TaxID=1869339 RepID=UPI0013BE63C9|nr:GreA/GreB family elongation factor [Polaromonas sp.]NDP63642.1 transcription elongation factor GreAB [Polaromonas sp.]
MHAEIDGERTLTELDFARLNKLRDRYWPVGLVAMDQFTDLVASTEIAPDIVTMYSQVEIVDLGSRCRHKLTLCYPGDAEPGIGFISVLSPVGASLLGLRVGSIARWHTPHGDACSAQVVAMLFQPEASGDYAT